jgi:hypothetical protein
MKICCPLELAQRLSDTVYGGVCHVKSQHHSGYSNSSHAYVPGNYFDVSLQEIELFMSDTEKAIHAYMPKLERITRLLIIYLVFHLFTDFSM